MKNSELRKFTHAELANFTHEELTMFPADILKKIHEDDRPLPISVIERIESLCEVLPQGAPKPDKLKTFKDAVGAVVSVARFLVLLPELSEKFSPIVESIIEEIVENFN